MSQADVRCPICGSEAFVAIGSRPQGRCARCLSTERGRFFWLLQQKRGLLPAPGRRIAHIAPERWLIRYTDLPERYDYQAFDLEPQRYRGFWPQTRFLDLARGFEGVDDGAFDLLLHHHVLEHVRAPLEPILAELKRVLAPGGVMAWAVPVRSGGVYDEALDPALAPETLRRRFGQANHVRIFGDRDLREQFRALLGDGCEFDTAACLAPEDARRAAIPESVLVGVTGHTTFLYVKPAN